MPTDDVCRIIELAARSGASVLKFGGLYVRFGATAGKVQQHPAYIPPAIEVSEDQHKKMSEDALKESELRIREEQLALMRIEDPARFEEMLQNGELDDAVDDASGDEDDS